MMARIVRDFGLTPLREVSLVGTLAIAGVWWWGGPPWQGLLTALVGMVGCGGTIWLVRIFASAALGKEAMGFGDVTLMMMIGTFVGWQAGVLIFFLAPFAALVLGVAQLVLGRGDALPYGPFLCLATALVVVRWGEFWSYTAPLFAAGWLVPIVLVVCLMLCGAMLAVWSLIKRALGAL
jgi:prepilin signal peptidase PulO-like enzyme (type II secretory pathway)